MIRSILAGTIMVTCANLGWAAPSRLELGILPSGPAKVAIEKWVTAGQDVTCSGGDAVGGACDIGRLLGVRSFYDASGSQAVVFMLYSPEVSNGAALAVGQFRRYGSHWSLIRTLRGIQGEGPDNLSFDGDRATFSMNALMPGDARCCLTGKQRYEVDLTTGSITAGQKTVVELTSRSGSKVTVIRPAGYAGATYFHNGSEVLVDERAGIIRYQVPKPSIRQAVSKGTVLFRGLFASDGKILGTAYVFKAGCEPLPYSVEGQSRGSIITLRGSAPRRNPSSCAQAGLSTRGVHSLLVFQEYGDF